MDNDLLTLWCNALVLDEGQVRDIIGMVQEARDGAESDKDDEIAELEENAEEDRKENRTAGRSDRRIGAPACCRRAVLTPSPEPLWTVTELAARSR